MKYRRTDAKAYARNHMKGIWAAALMPFAPDLSVDEAGFRRNLRHWVDELGIDGVFVAGKQSEFFSMSVAERKRSFEVIVDEIGDRAGTIASCSDQNMDTVIDLAKHAQAVGCEYIVVHAPVLHFLHKQDDTLYQYYKTISEQVDTGIAMWSHPDSGYLMSPELCARIAELPNIVAIKYSVPREMYVRLTRMVGDKIQVSTASEEEWFDNIVELGWRLYLCSSPPYLFQTKADRRMREYTDLAFSGDVAKAKIVRDSLNPVREAFRRTRPAEKPPAHSKYWQELMGQVGGRVRAPMLELTAAEKEATRRAFETCGLQVPVPADNLRTMDLPPDSVSAIARRLQLLRAAFGVAQGYPKSITQSEMARQCGLTAQAWNNWEMGRDRIGLDSASKICVRTGATLDYIYHGDMRGIAHILAVEIEKLKSSRAA